MTNTASFHHAAADTGGQILQGVVGKDEVAPTFDGNMAARPGASATPGVRPCDALSRSKRRRIRDRAVAVRQAQQKAFCIAQMLHHGDDAVMMATDAPGLAMDGEVCPADPVAVLAPPLYELHWLLIGQHRLGVGSDVHGMLDVLQPAPDAGSRLNPAAVDFCPAEATSEDVAVHLAVEAKQAESTKDIVQQRTCSAESAEDAAQAETLVDAASERHQVGGGEPQQVAQGHREQVEAFEPQVARRHCGRSEGMQGLPEEAASGLPQQVAQGHREQVKVSELQQVAQRLRERGHPEEAEGGEPQQVAQGHPEEPEFGEPLQVAHGHCEQVEVGKPQQIAQQRRLLAARRDGTSHRIAAVMEQQDTGVTEESSSVPAPIVKDVEFFGIAPPVGQVVTSREECLRHARRGARFRRFSSREEAEKYANG